MAKLRRVKKDPNWNNVYLTQNPNTCFYHLLDNTDTIVGNTNIKCKDYFQEIFGHLITGKWENKTQYGLKIDPHVYGKLRDYDKWTIAIKSSQVEILAADVKKGIEVFKRAISELNTPDIQNNLSVEYGYSKTVFLTFNKAFFINAHYISTVLLLIREALVKQDGNCKLENILTNTEEETLSQFANSSVLTVSYWNAIKVFYNKFSKNFSHSFTDLSEKSITYIHNNTGIYNVLSGKINREKDFNLVYVYGTLRKNHGNHAHFLKEQSEYMGTYKIHRKLGCSQLMFLYNLGSYPGIKCVSSRDYDTIIRLKKITDPTITVETEELAN